MDKVKYLLLLWLIPALSAWAQEDFLLKRMGKSRNSSQPVFTLKDSFDHKESYYPFTELGDAIISLPVTFVVITDSSRSQGLSHSEATRNSLHKSIELMNALYEKNAEPVDEMPGRAYVEDIKLRVRLQEIIFLDDPELYEYRQLAGLYQQLYERYPLLRNTLVIVCNRFLYPGALGWANDVRVKDEAIPGYIIQSLVVDDMYFHGYENEYAQHWVHEINHLFDLGHIYAGSIGTESCDPRSKDFLEDVFGTEPQPWCDNARSPCTVCYYTGENSIRTNNIMSGNNVKSPSSAAYFSPMQIARIHRQLMIDPISYIAEGHSTERPVHIKRSDTLRRNMRFYQDIYLEEGVTWVVESEVRMSQGTTIYIEPGAYLIVDGGSINPAAFITYKAWKGVRMLRDGLEQGMIRLKNGGSVNTAPPDW